MKLNKNIVKDRLFAKLSGDALSCIVTECFIKSLPMDNIEKTRHLSEFTNYANSVITKMHPESLLKNALEGMGARANGKDFLKGLHEDITRIATNATNRILMEADLETSSLEEIENEADFDEDEFAQISAASKKAGTDAVAEIVQNNVIDTIKEEQAAYDRSAKLKNDIKDLIAKERNEDEEVTDETLEAYCNITLDPTDAREHISFFSRLNDICYENYLTRSINSYDEMSFDYMTEITLESTLPIFDLTQRTVEEDIKSLVIATEGQINIAENGCDDGRLQKISKASFITSTCILSMLEVLKTLRLKTPTINMVKAFVDTPPQINSGGNNISRIGTAIDNIANGIKKSAAMGSVTKLADMPEIKEKLIDLKVSMEKVNNTMNKDELQMLSDKIDNAIEAATQAFNQLEEASESYGKGYFNSRAMEQNHCEIERAATSLARRQGVKTLSFNVNSKATFDDTNIEVVGLSAANEALATFNINLNANSNLGESTVTILQDAIKVANTKDKKCVMRFIDSDYSINLK